MLTPRVALIFRQCNAKREEKENEMQKMQNLLLSTCFVAVMRRRLVGAVVVVWRLLVCLICVRTHQWQWQANLVKEKEQQQSDQPAKVSPSA